MSHLHEELEVGHELDMLLRTSMTTLAQLVETVARRSTDGARATAEQTRHQTTEARDRWLEHRDAARAQYGPWMLPGTVENGDRVAATRAWSQAAGWAGQDPSAAQAAPALRDRIGARFGVTPEAILRSTDPDQEHPTGVPAGAMNVAEAVDLARQYAPSYYQAHDPQRLGPISSSDPSTPAQQQLVGDWQAWAAAGQIPRESLMLEWARHTGNAGVLDASLWRGKDGGVDRSAMHAALVRAWDDGREQRASEELSAHLRQAAGAGLGTADIERGTGNATDQETDYRPMLDPAVLAAADDNDAIAAYGAARVAAQRGEPGANDAVDQLEQQLSSRWKASPGVYLADAIADIEVARTDSRRESEDVRRAISHETGQAKTPAAAETVPALSAAAQRGVAPSKATTPGERDHRERSWAMSRAEHRASLDPDTNDAQANLAWRALPDRERYARYWDVYDTPGARGDAPDVAPTRQPASTPTPTSAQGEPAPAPAGEQRSDVTQGRVLELNEQAATWLGERFTPGTPGHAYISDRLGADVADAGAYRFGYAPPGWRHLSDHLRKNGATDHELIEAGLGRLSSRGSVIDVFRDRATVAIRSRPRTDASSRHRGRT